MPANAITIALDGQSLSPACLSSLQDRVALGDDGRSLVLRGPLSRPEFDELRKEHTNDPQWQVLVDRVVIASAAQRSAGDGQPAFPTTLWGLLLVELDSGSDLHWERFVERYRDCISRMAQRLLRHHARGGQDDYDLAADFFGWFFARRIHTRLRLLDEDGRVYRFRGYLKRCLRTFIRDQRSRIPVMDLAPEAAAVESEIDAVVDREFARDAIEVAVSRIARNDHALWTALVAELRGRTLADIAAELREASAGQSGSIAQAHAVRHRARKALRRLLIQYRLADGTASQEEAEAEYESLIPDLAAALRDVVETAENGATGALPS